MCLGIGTVEADRMKLYVCGDRGNLYEKLGANWYIMNPLKTVTVGDKSCDVYDVRPNTAYLYVVHDGEWLIVEEVMCRHSDLPDPLHLQIKCIGGRSVRREVVKTKVAKTEILKALGVYENEY